MHPSDEELVRAYLRDGDERAFRQLVERHQEKVYGYLYGLVRDREVANDLFQETFLRAINALHSRRAGYEDQGRWVGWIMRIARNAALDYLRTRRKWIDVSAGAAEDGETFWDGLKDVRSNAQADLEGRENGELLESFIDRLPAEQKEVLLMRHESELSFKEIARITDCSINTALGRMRYALLNLRRMYQSIERRTHADTKD